MQIYLQKIKWSVLVFFALSISLFGLTYFSFNPSMGLLSAKPAELVQDFLYRTVFYLHIAGGAIALTVGVFALMPKMRRKNISLHRKMGKTYVIAILIGGIAGGIMAFFSEGGNIAHAGYFMMAATWLATTYFAYRFIRQKDIARHQAWMLRSYAVTFAGVTFRLWLPILFFAIGMPQQEGFAWLAWISWVPNLLVMEGYLWMKRSRKQAIASTLAEI